RRGASPRKRPQPTVESSPLPLRPLDHPARFGPELPSLGSRSWVAGGSQGPGPELRLGRPPRVHPRRERTVEVAAGRSIESLAEHLAWAEDEGAGLGPGLALALGQTPKHALRPPEHIVEVHPARVEGHTNLVAQKGGPCPVGLPVEQPAPSAL